MDKRAKKILLDKFWGTSGWKNEEISEQDFEYAKSKGVMFDPVILSHDNVVANTRFVIQSLDKKRVTDAFISSLTSRRLDLRSALSGYACGIKLPNHQFQSDSSKRCAICAEADSRKPIDLNVLNFERIKFGGVRHLQPIYIWLDLSLFSAESAEKPGQEDIKLLAQILESLSELKSAKLSDVEKHLKFIKSNKSEREAIVAALGYCGILHVPGYPCFYEEYILSEQREYSNYARSDWPFPADLWLPEFGVNDRSINFWFADYL